MRHNKFLPFASILLCLLFAAPTAYAQFRVTDSGGKSKKEKKEKKGKSDFTSKLWYGGGINLGFSGYNGGSVFAFGVAPMVGYKFYGPFSAGPRLSIQFASYKFQGFKNLNLFDTEAGLFLRARVFRGFFLQGEIATEWVQEPYEFLSNKTISKLKFQRANQYFGAGYNFANGEGGPGTEIGIFYNVAVGNDPDSYLNPWDYRFTFTWNF